MLARHWMDPEPSEPPTPTLTRELKRYYLYHTFAILWIFPALGGLIIAWPILRLDWSDTGKALEAIAVDQWLGLMLVAMQIIFAWKAWVYARLTAQERSSP